MPMTQDWKVLALEFGIATNPIALNNLADFDKISVVQNVGSHRQNLPYIQIARNHRVWL